MSNYAELKSILEDRLEYTVNDIMVRYGEHYHLPPAGSQEDYSSRSDCIAIQYYLDEADKKVYVYMLIDSDFRIDKADYVHDAYCYISKDIERYIPNYLGRGFRIYVLGPGNKYTRDRSHTINQSLRVTPNTFTFWKSINGRYEFIEDKVSMIKAVSKELALNLHREESATWKKHVLAGLNDINNTYQFKYNPDVSTAIQDAFADLRELYIANCNVVLNQIPDNSIEKLYLIKDYNDD